MIDLMKYEFYKIFKQKILWSTLLLIFIGSLYFSLQMIGNDLKASYENLEGVITEQKINKAHIEDQNLIEEGNENSSVEKKSLRAAHDKLFYAEHYREMQQKKITDTLNKAESANSKYEENFFLLKAKMLKTIHYNYFEYQRPMEQAVLFMTTGSMVLILTFIILSVSLSYTSEYTSGVANYLFSSVNGRSQTLWAKLLTNWTIIALIAIFSTLIATLIWGIYDGFSGWNSPLQSIEKFYESPYSLTIGQYIIVSILFQILIGIALSTLILFVSLISKNFLQSIIFTLMIIGIPHVFTSILPITFFSENFLLVMNFAPSVCLNTNVLFMDFITINVGGIPVLLPIIIVLFMLILTIIILVILFKVIKQKHI